MQYKLLMVMTSREKILKLNTLNDKKAIIQLQECIWVQQKEEGIHHLEEGFEIFSFSLILIEEMIIIVIHDQMTEEIVIKKVATTSVDNITEMTEMTEIVGPEVEIVNVKIMGVKEDILQEGFFPI